MVSRLQVDLRKDIFSFDMIKQVIVPRVQVTVLYVHLIKLVIIDAHLHCTILFIYERCRCSQRGHTWLDIPFFYRLLQLQFEFHQF